MNDGTRKWTLSEALQSLPKSGIKIKELLEQEGVTGRRGSVGVCPLALYLKRHWGGYWAVGRNLVICKRGPGDEEYAPSPKQVRLFVESFDEGMYPSLVRKSSGSTPDRRPTTRNNPSGPKRAAHRRTVTGPHRFRAMVGR